MNWARRATALAPNDETELRSLLELLADVGDRAGAVEAYDAFARRLAADYEIAPSAETQFVIQRIRERSAAIPPKPALRANPSETDFAASVAPATPMAQAAPPGRRRQPQWRT